MCGRMRRKLSFTFRVGPYKRECVETLMRLSDVLLMTAEEVRPFRWACSYSSSSVVESRIKPRS
jgi:hypothetical protein